MTYVNGSVKAFYLLGKSNNYAFCKAVCEWIVNKFCDTYGEEYAVLYKHKQTINKDICIPAIGMEYRSTIKLLLDKYHLAECWFYKEEPITDNVYVDYYQGWRKKFFNLTKVPTIEEIYENKVFSKDEQTKYVQLKYDVDKEIITTSKGAKVRLNDAILLWKVYKQTISSGNPTISSPHNDFTSFLLADKGIKCGLYPVTGIYRNLKHNNSGNRVGYYAWNVVIGCHTIWIDDFIDFVKYYNLQKYFPN